jgi:hypothetical protein
MTILCNKLENKTDCFGGKIHTIKALLKQLYNRRTRPKTRGLALHMPQLSLHLHKLRVHDPTHEFHVRSISLTNSEEWAWVYELSDLTRSKHQFPVLLLAGVRATP